jgi:DNA-binding transcriptional MerR regulator
MAKAINRRSARLRPKPKARPAAASSSSSDRGLKIGEAARALGVETYVLRFWETQFPILKPQHSRSKHRFYGAREIEVLRVIKRLLHNERFTIAGANRVIKDTGIDALIAGKTVARTESAAPRASGGDNARRVLSDVRRELQTLHKMLEG